MKPKLLTPLVFAFFTFGCPRTQELIEIPYEHKTSTVNHTIVELIGGNNPAKEPNHVSALDTLANASEPNKPDNAMTGITLVELVKRIQPAVVTVISFDKDDNPVGQGSGFFISGKGHVITNQHVVEGAHSATVKIADGGVYRVVGVLAADPNSDIVKLLVDTEGNQTPYITPVNIVPLVAEEIVVVGSPFGLESTVSKGIVSAIRKLPAIGNILQISAPISQGSSGSPVLDLEGQVVGVATFMLTEGQALNFAVPSEKVLALRSDEKPLNLQQYAQKHGWKAEEPNPDLLAFLKGQTRKYSTKGHPKAKGLNISFEYPSHWRNSEGERPNIVQKFSSDASGGIMKGGLILIKDLPAQVKASSSEDISDFLFTLDALKETLPDGARFIRGEQTKYDGQPGAWRIIEMETERAGVRVKLYILTHMFLYSDKLVNVQCCVSGLAEGGTPLQEVFFKHLLLFHLIGNSIVIQDKWSGSERTPRDSPASSRLPQYEHETSANKVTKEVDGPLAKATVRYTSKQDGFSVTLPSAPTIIETPLAENHNMRTYRAQQGELVQYYVHVGVPDDKILSQESIRAFLDNIVAARQIAVSESHIVKNVPTTFRGFDAQEYEYESMHEGMTVIHKGIVFLIDGDNVSLTLVYFKGVEPGLEFDDFIKTFRLLPLEPVLTTHYWIDKDSGLRFRPPADMSDLERERGRNGLIVTFANKAGHSMSIFDVTSVYPNITWSDVRRELSKMKDCGDGYYENIIVETATMPHRVQLMKYVGNGDRIYMIQGYAPQKTYFRSVQKFKEAMKSLSFDK